METLGQDLKFAVRTLRQMPGFSAIAIGSSAVGIGAASVLFALLNAAVLKPLPVADHARLMSISEIDRRSGEIGNELSYLDYLDVRRAGSFEAVAAISPFIPASIDAQNDPQRHWGAIATANYFSVVQPAFVAGRGFDQDRDDLPGQPPVVVISHTLWSARFHSDAGVIGRTVAINGRAATIVGVTAAGFSGTESGVAPEFWIPFSMLDDIEARMGPVSKNRGRHWLDVIGRLRRAASVESARAELGVIAGRLNTEYLRGNQDRGFHVERAGQLAPALRSMAGTSFAVALALAVLVVVTGCVNVANLLLGRSAARSREIAARMALGASRSRIIRQLLTESMVLALLGGVAGWLIAAYVCSLIGFARAPLGWPLDFAVQLDLRVLGFCIATSAIVGGGFGLLPAYRATQPDLANALKSDSRTSSADRTRTRSVLVVAQIAVCVVLLLCSGLSLRSLRTARSLDLGFANRNILLLAFDPGLNHRPDEVSRVLLRHLLNRVQEVPGIESATLTSAVPLTFIIDNSNFVWDLRAKDANPPRVRTDIYTVGPRFFETFGIPVQAGSDLNDESPAGQRRTIVNAAFARAAFQDDSPLGRQILGDGKALEVAGIVSTAKSRTIGEEPRPAIFLPIFSEYVAAHAQRGITLAVRTNVDAASMTGTVRTVIRSVDPSLAVFDVRTMETHIADAMIVPRLTWAVSGVAGGIGLVLAIVGIYAVISFAVARRRRELGIRLAIGAVPREVLLLVLKQGLTLAVIGTAVGVAAAIGVTRFAESLLYGIDPIDPLTFLAAPALLLAVAVAACLIPARAAARLDPVEVLRAE